MLDSETKRRIDTCRDILVGKVPDPKSQVEQITIALIYKFMDDMDAEAEELGGRRSFFANGHAKYGWAKVMAPDMGGFDMLALYSEAIQKMNENPGIPPLFRDIFKNAFLPYRDPETLRLFLKEIDGFTYDHSERLGDAFEYLLSVLGSQGDAGQFRTPRHIIDFMVEVIDPKKNESILDPACGTAGFLISAWKHIVSHNTGKHALKPEERANLAANIRGYDISPDMVRLSLVNMYLHGFTDPHIVEYDTLTSEERWNETADIILANPPFMSPKGGIKPHKRFSVQATRSEVLFVDYIAEHLSPQGRAAIVVPEGIIFQSGTAYKQLREMLVKTSLAAVVSLPAGVFNPYSGVKTSILILDRRLAKTCDSVLFVKVQNDGYNLGAQRRAVAGSDLPEAARVLQEWMRGQFDEKSALATRVERARIWENKEWNLSGEKYQVDTAGATKWPMVELGKFARLINGRAYKQEELLAEGPTPVLRVGNFFSNRGWYYSTLELDQDKYCEAGDLLYAWSASFGPRIWDGPRAIYHYHIWKVVPTEAIDKMFLFHLLAADSENIKAEGNGIAMVHATKGGMEQRKFPLPPLAIQKEIVAEIEGYQKIIDGARAVLDNYRPHISIHFDWPTEVLGDVISTVTPPVKIQARDFNDAGRYPIIDQSQNAVAGRTDDESALIDGRGGLVIFGDHTCAVKFVNEPFAQGADGIKIIKTDARLEPKFVYFYLLSHPIEQDGYRRHFGKLRECRIPIPPLATQQTIVAEIEAEQALVNANKQLIERFGAKIRAAINRVWGGAEYEDCRRGQSQKG